MLSFGLAAGLAVPLTATASVTPDVGARAELAQGHKPKPAKPQKPAKSAKAKEAKPDKPVAQQQNAQRRNDDRRDRVVDRDGHVRVIRDYSRAGLPPGLAKREQLPPGLRKQIREKGTLPPGLQKRLVPVPAEWSSRLPAINDYERRYFAGDDLIIIDTRTNRIVAYIVDILR